MTLLYATIADLEARMGVEITDSVQARAALADASALIHLESRGAWVGESGEADNPPAVVVAVACSAARRVLENPLGVRSESEAIGSFQASQSYANDSNDVFLKRSEAAKIRQAAGLGGLGVVRTTRGPVESGRLRESLESRLGLE